MISLASSLILTLDKRATLAYLRGVREQSRNRIEVVTLSALIRKIEDGDLDG